MGKQLTFEQKVALFQKAHSTRADRDAHAKSWAGVVLEKLPKEASVRSIFTIDPLPPQANSIYTLDLDYVSAWVLPHMGATPENLLQTEEVTIPTFEITGDVAYKLRFAEQGRFNVAERAQQRLTDSIVDQEETAGWALIRAATAGSLDNVSDITSSESGLSKKTINSAFKKMESRRGHQITDIYVSSNRAADIRDWTDTDIDPVTRREIFVQKGVNSIWQANINVAHFLSDTEAYFIDARPNLLGYMPVRKNLITFDDPTAIKKFQVGIVAYEELGFGILEPLRIVKAVID